MPQSNDQYIAKLSFKNGNTTVDSSALDLSKSCSIEVAIPREVGALNVYVKVLSENMSEEMFYEAFEWERISEGYDYYIIKLPKVKFKAGLYFLDIWIESFEKTYYLTRHSNIFFLNGDKNYGRPIQLTLYTPIINNPKRILGGIIYHIFVDRFARGGRSVKKPSARFIDGDWQMIPEFPLYPGAPLKNNTFFGGTLDGVRSKLLYLKELGVNIIYLSPIFESPSNHRYDTANYMKVDEMLGGDEALYDLIKDAEKNNIKVILDGVFNHTGADSIYFNKYKNYGIGGAYNDKNSPYYSWYEFTEHPSKYTCWWDIEILPRINPDKKDCGEYFVGKGGVIEKYRKMGIYGFRLDVCDELSDEFIAKIKSKLSEDGESYLLGEVWEDASNKVAYGKRKRYFLGSELDGVMNYPLRRGIIDYITGKGKESLDYAINEVLYNVPEKIRNTQMNILGTHDTERIITALSGESYEGVSNEQLRTKKLSSVGYKLAKKRLLSAYTILATMPGIPTVFYGDEVGLEGYSDPFNRMPYPYGKEDCEILDHYRKIGEIRRATSVYADGKFKLLQLTLQLFAFIRFKGNSAYITVMNNSDKTLELKGNIPLQALIDKQNCQRIPPYTAEIFKAKTITIFKANKRNLL